MAPIRHRVHNIFVTSIVTYGHCYQSFKADRAPSATQLTYPFSSLQWPKTALKTVKLFACFPRARAPHPRRGTEAARPAESRARRAACSEAACFQPLANGCRTSNDAAIWTPRLVFDMGVRPNVVTVLSVVTWPKASVRSWQ